jgi:hypothetical protein
MTLMKSILLGSAAGIVAVAAAQAADLPTKKAAPAEYVKICNVGGMAGFVLPGSDTCFKISGYITGQIEAGNLKQGFSWVYGTGATTGLAAVVTNGANGVGFARSGFGWTTRLNLGVDARSETAYGILRGYAEMQFENGSGFDNTGTGAYINRAYVQWAGITAGKSNSFFSFFGGGEAWANIFSPDRQGFNQPDLLAYTATFGGGFSATLSFESPGSNGFSGGGTQLGANGATAAGLTGATGGPLVFGVNNAYGGEFWPDIVGVLRVDQGWGAAQISGVAHEVRVQDTLGNTEHKWGWAILGGVKWNSPWGPGDNFQIQGVWSRNAFWYSGIPDGMWGENGAVNGNGLAMVPADTWSNGDGSFATPDAWSIEAFYEHHFNAQWSGAVEGSYAQVNWNGLASNIGGVAPNGAGVLVPTGAFGTAIPEHAQSWIVGAVAHWDPVVNLDFEFELLYQSTHQSTPLGVVLAPNVAQFPTNAQGVAGRFEVTRSF